MTRTCFATPSAAAAPSKSEKGISKSKKRRRKEEEREETKKKRRRRPLGCSRSFGDLIDFPSFFLSFFLFFFFFLACLTRHRAAASQCRSSRMTCTSCDFSRSSIKSRRAPSRFCSHFSMKNLYCYCLYPCIISIITNPTKRITHGCRARSGRLGKA